MFTNQEYNDLNEKWFNSDQRDNVTKKYAQIDRVDRELIYITKYIDGYRDEIIEGMTRVALHLIGTSEELIRELASIEKKKEEEENTATFEAFKKKFTHNFHRVHNFSGMFVRYLRDSKIRDNIFKNGGFDILIQLLSLH